MPDVQTEIGFLQAEMQKADAAITKAISNRRAIGKDSPLAADAQAAVVAAREAATVVELKLRQLYETKGD